MNKKALIFPVIIFLIFFNCATPEEPVGPKWTMSLSKIPILKADTVNVGEELESDNVKPDANKLLHISFTDSSEFNVVKPPVIIPGTVQLPLSTIDQELFKDPPEGLEYLQFEQVNIIIRSINAPFSFTIHLDFAGTKKGTTYNLSSEITIPAGNTSPHSINIANIVNKMPESIRITGWVRFSAQDITQTAKYQLEYSIDLPLRFSLTNVSTIENTEKLELDQDARDAIKDNVINASLEGKIINETPVSGTIQFFVGFTEATANNLLFSLTLPKRGTEGQINLSIDKQKLDKLVTANYFRIYVSVDSVINGELKSTDHIIVKDVFLSGTGKIDLSKD
jgi:hypothetical protein